MPPDPNNQEAPRTDLAFAREIYELTAADVMSFFQEKEKPNAAKCPICETDNWEAVFPSTSGTVNLMIGDLGGLIGGTAIHCVGLACKNCGYVRLHSTIPIVNWKRGRQP